MAIAASWLLVVVGTDFQLENLPRPAGGRPVTLLVPAPLFINQFPDRSMDARRASAPWWCGPAETAKGATC